MKSELADLYCLKSELRNWRPEELEEIKTEIWIRIFGRRENDQLVKNICLVDKLYNEMESFFLPIEIRVPSFGEGGRSGRLGQCPKFSRFLILETSLSQEG